MQADQIRKRYGVESAQKEQIPDWQKSLKQYEADMNKKIKAAANAGKLHRKLGEAFAELESYQLCVQHLERAIDLGYATDEVFYKLGLCQGSLARNHGWPSEKTKAAEKTFLKVLNLNPKFDKAKFQLGLIYFYGFGNNNRYRVLSSTLTIEQSQFRDHAIKLIRQYQNLNPEDEKSYFALAGIYKKQGEFSSAMNQMRALMGQLESSFPESFASNKVYQAARSNLASLQSSGQFKK